MRRRPRPMIRPYRDRRGLGLACSMLAIFVLVCHHFYYFARCIWRVKQGLEYVNDIVIVHVAGAQISLWWCWIRPRRMRVGPGCVDLRMLCGLEVSGGRNLSISNTQMVCASYKGWAETRASLPYRILTMTGSW
jgi:hypothetical protein